MEIRAQHSDTGHKTQDTNSLKKGFRKLIVWQKADDLALEVYKKTKTFPKEELFGITSQLRRASISIPTNISEAMGRQNRNETKQFINIALGSLAEVEYLLEFCCKLKLFNSTDYEFLEEKRRNLGGLLWKLYKIF